MNTTRHPNRPVRYWRKNHPTVTAGEGVDPFVALADIARDHPDWSDETVIARLKWEVSETERIRPIIAESCPRRD